MFVVPVLLGAFVGAPLISRELDTGTFRFAWTQGAGRTRWAISTLVLPALLLTAVTGAFTALLWWYFRPFLADGQVSEFLPLAFGLLGVAFAAWTLFAYALAAFTGTLLRRTMPAMAVTLIVYIVLAIADRDRDQAALRGPGDRAGLESGRRGRLGHQQLDRGAQRPARQPGRRQQPGPGQRAELAEPGRVH